MGLLCRKVTLKFVLERFRILFSLADHETTKKMFAMSLWDWLLAAWIYEELFDDDSDNTSNDNTRDYDSSYDYDDYDEYF